MKKYKLDTTKHGVWFTSDTHFRHSGVIRYCNRPFADVDEMDETLIENWNARISPRDFVFHVGDFAFTRDQEEFDAIARRLNGTKILIPGNHDGSVALKSKHFVDKIDLLEIQVNNQPIVLCHNAMLTWNRSHYGAWQLFGHSHGNIPVEFLGRQMDVGVDANNYCPISFEEVAEVMKTREPKEYDHHRADRVEKSD